MPCHLEFDFVDFNTALAFPRSPEPIGRWGVVGLRFGDYD